ncbi:hypothetical protein [Flammeovirga pacifica]|uniref:STAS/SEC14 domain-containing protein n=1 Tax=Flammeovirga pacifica TaxID=915059 RepID=A0A1S1YZ86_FLAPC|nr:hypothetical protein [Flammeovirga pacifica]OHX66326.1 hypothetical protein NH26_08155 [Flammeovirga pacifica]
MKFNQIYKSDFQEIGYNESYQIIKSTWNTPINLSEKIYRQELNQYFDILKQTTPKNVLVDAVKAYYQILPETQEWMQKRSFEIHKEVNLKKMAWLVSSDLFSQMTFDQAIENLNEVVEFQLKYFDDLDDAQNWLK